VHGRDTYYGRHFFYRAQGGQIYVVTVPPLGRVGAERHGELDLDDYPTLRATCSALDAIGTRLYDDATIPITLAHKYAAYPLTTAGQVLKPHAEERLDVRWPHSPAGPQARAPNRPIQIRVLTGRRVSIGIPLLVPGAD
jgi:hypothetical protein